MDKIKRYRGTFWPGILSGTSNPKRRNMMKQTLAEALAQKAYDTLTPVQQAVTQPELEGRDLLVSAQTGSGKTIGFGLAIAPTVLGADDVLDRAGAPLALIIAPTRELAIQVKRELSWLYKGAGGFLASCVGGMDMRDERRSLARGAHMVVATPGRLRDHIMRGSIDLSQVRAVVLDEADEMLDLGFREDLEFILEQTPQARQTLLFSATVPPAIAKLAEKYQQGAERISTVSTSTQHADIDYRATLVAPSDSDNAVINLLRYYEAPNAIVFCNTRAMVARLTTRLSNRGFSVVALSGELTQGERSNALQAMRDGRARVCVATDVAARGIDLPKLDLVIHAELPKTHETLLHRSGRTGRAGRKGVSALVVTRASHKKAERILKLAKVTAEWGAAPSASEIDSRDMARMLEGEDWQAPVSESDQPAVESLVASFSAKELAAAYLRQFKARHTAPEDLVPVSFEPAQKRAPFGASVWFSLPEGRADAVSPKYLLPMICKAGGLTKDDIGAIRIAETESYIEIKESSVPALLEAIGPQMQVEKGKILTQLDTPPDVPEPKRGARKRPFGKTQPPKGKPFKERGGKPAERKSPETKSPAKHPPEKSAEKSPHKARVKGTPAPSGRPKPNSGKGPPPPKGKPSSKKNRARVTAKKQHSGGDVAPRRKRP
jgi:ATP-dependent RNA helicase DeaD